MKTRPSAVQTRAWLRLTVAETSLRLPSRPMVSTGIRSGNRTPRTASGACTTNVPNSGVRFAGDPRPGFRSKVGLAMAAPPQFVPYIPRGGMNQAP